MRMKDGTTRLGYKPEHVVDMETGAILSVVVQGGNEHDASTIRSTLAVAEQNIASIRPNRESNDIVGERWPGTGSRLPVSSPTRGTTRSRRSRA